MFNFPCNLISQKITYFRNQCFLTTRKSDAGDMLYTSSIMKHEKLASIQLVHWNFHNCKFRNMDDTKSPNLHIELNLYLLQVWAILYICSSFGSFNRLILGNHLQNKWNSSDWKWFQANMYINHYYIPQCHYREHPAKSYRQCSDPRL